MLHLSVRRRLVGPGALVAAAVLAACEDKRVKQLDTGITRDSAVTVLAQEIRGGGGRDSFPNVYKRARYLANGKHIEVLYFTPNNEKAGKDTVPMRKLTPLVFIENKLVAKGWPALDSIARANNLALEDRSK